jgi:filamentous hemagglutinin family protein
MTTTTFGRRAGALLLAACYGAAAGTHAAPAPALPQIGAGQASFSLQGNVFSIVNTPGTILNWQSFNVNPGEVTRFVQQSADSAVLNRVLGQDPSKILGALQSNGKVFLINPNGILFGANARVDVNGLVASTLDIADADFKAGKKSFTVGSHAGSVRNEGTIATPAGGRVFLIAPDVTNAGVISAPNGELVLAAGHSVQLVDSQDPDLRVVVSAPNDQAVNLGQVTARAGRVGIYGALVNQRGLASADSAVRGADGQVVLKASRSATLGAGSVTSAVGTGEGASGGAIHVLGDTVDVKNGALLDASGQAGGGSVLVGGGYQGGGALAHATTTAFAGGATIRADATAAGNGGQVVLWSDGQTSATGSISARGTGGGHGGKVETSGHLLAVNGIRVDTSAGPGAGMRGTWLLDPYDIEVVNSGTATANDVSAAGNGLQTGWTYVAPGTLTAGGNVELKAQDDIKFTDPLNASGDVLAVAGHDIIVNGRVGSATGNLDFRAANAFTLASGGSLKSDNYIDIQANSMSLLGSIGQQSAQTPILSLNTATPSQKINLGTGVATDTLWIDPARLGALSQGLYEINIGTNQHTGDVTVSGAFAGPPNLVLENQGNVTLSAPVDLSANAGSQLLVNLYGANHTITVTQAIAAGAGIQLQGDTIKLQNTATVTNGGVTLQPTSGTANIQVGGDPSGSGFVIDRTALANVRANALTISAVPGGSGVFTIADASLSGIGSPNQITLDAGNADMGFNAALQVPGTLILKTQQTVYESGAGQIAASNLAMRTGYGAMMGGANAVASLAMTNAHGGSDSVLFNNAGNLRIGSVDNIDGVTTGGEVQMQVTGGALLLGQPLSGTVVDLDAAGIRSTAASGVITATSLKLASTAGIGTDTLALQTAAASIDASNTYVGALPINIANQGALALTRAVQLGGGNAGSITVDSVGGMTIPVYRNLDGLESGVVRTSSGNIGLTTHSPLTISGQVSTQSGNVSLTAANDGALTINSGAQVASTSGNVAIVAGSSSIPSGTISVASADRLSVTNTIAPQSPAPPTLDQCLANSNLAGCAAVLQAATRTCQTNPAAPHCADLAPTYDTCSKTPSAYGCAAVIAQHDAIAACIANPSGAGCGTTLPTYDTCAKTPSTYGCAPVIQQHNDAIAACVANPAGPNCGAILPTYDACVANASAPGCDYVIAQHNNSAVDACIRNPSGANCGSILPTYDACAKNPSAYGCDYVITQHNKAVAACLANPSGPNCGAIVPTYAYCTAAPSAFGCDIVIAQHDAITACMANTQAPGCAQKLPTLDQCRADPGVYGCSAVLARAQFDSCLANPSAPGCGSVLPSLDVCKRSAALEGCAQVLELGFQACLLAPNAAGCSGILPTLGECVSDKTKRGCDAVLPTFDQCVASPSLQGCEVRLPSLATCAQAPTTQGCQAVLPTASFCSTHPGDASCVVFTGNGGNGGSGDGQGGKQGGGSPVAQAVQQTVQLISSGTNQVVQTTGLPSGSGSGAGAGSTSGSGSSSGKQSSVTGALQTENTGAKNEKPAAKTYCN